MTSDTTNGQTSRRATAIHEAGHAVIAVSLHVPIRMATIRPTAECAGLVLHPLRWLKTVARAFEEGDDGKRISVATQSIMVSLAGRIAEEVVLGHHGPPWSYRHDEENISEIVFRLCVGPDEGDAFVGWLTLRTRQRVQAKRVRAQIERVADALLEHETLNAEAIRGVMFPPPPPFALPSLKTGT